jgi:hypothetical protein|tara:strand:+ start:1125 stop:1388 length:264 start_codon:yes stop_codon:yes gene_type:complete
MLKKIKKDFFGYMGLILIHSSTFPTIISNIVGNSNELPPLNMILLLFFGLSFYLIDSIKKGLVVYMISNCIGIFSQLTLLAILVFGG